MSFNAQSYENYSNDGMNEPSQNGSKSMAITSMVLGIVALVICLCFILSIPLGIVSIILAIIVLVKKKNGKPFAITGLVTSILGILVSIVTLISMMPYIQFGMELSKDPNAIVTMIDDYQQDGTIPQNVLDICGGNEEMAKSFMEGFVQSYGDVVDGND
ncbi:MAG: DUF4190 domain-containing protein [Oscillospiraceae bacterium]